MKNTNHLSDKTNFQEYNYKTFGNRLKHIMSIREITSKELAERMFFSPSAISGYRSGRRSPDVNQLLTLSKELNVSIDYLCGLSDDDSKIL